MGILTDDGCRRIKTKRQSPTGEQAPHWVIVFLFLHGSLHDLGSGAPFALFFSSLQKRQIIYRKKSKIVKIYQYSKNIENKLKYFKKCVDKCTALYYIKLNKRETEQPNREGWERSTKESIEREV